MNKIKELRVEKGFTQSQLAALLGVNQTAVGKYERGELEPNIHILIRLSQIFETTVDYIIGNTDDFGNIFLKTEAPNLSQEEQEIITTFRALPKELQAQVGAYVSTLGNLVAEEKKYKFQRK